MFILFYIFAEKRSRTYVFAVSTSVFAREIKFPEEMADNLIFNRMISISVSKGTTNH
ncbi:hypothetical protein [Proteiniphilum acetatigenes]|uniref:hypothetical protein n=1 Tax=Proteiniphilum acetatigenes TaxID=294710 RepID=UPI000376C008|nr:hypothetical protein [Proteiniphilum acetatigenes]SFK72955.1 hypothetical protein SAMN05216357_10598 [Porphyromonadaceae bacterium KH3CP3RA]